MKKLLNLVKQLLLALPAGSRRFIRVFAAALSALALLDIAALGILALLLGPLISGTSVTVPVIGITLSEPSDFGVALGIVCGLILLKGFLGIVVQRLSTRRFARFEQALGAKLLDSFFFAPWLDRLSRNSSDLVRSTDVGVSSTVSGILIPYTQLMGEIATFVAVITVLLIATPAMAIGAVVYFAAVGFFLSRWVLARAVKAGRDNRDYSTRSVRLISEMVQSLKEVTLRNKGDEIQNVVLDVRQKASTARANQVFLGSVPRYVLEMALIGGLAIAAAYGYSESGMEGAVAQLALFGVAGFRLVPAVTRFQTIMAQTAAAMPYAERVLDEIEIGRQNRESYAVKQSGRTLDSEVRNLRLDNVSFRYPNASSLAVDGVSFDIPFGSSLALVGESGSGKSTLVDIMLGLLEPTDGALFIDDVPMSEAMASWQSRVGYVPQHVAIFDSTVAHNVALTWEDSLIDDDRVRRALERAQLLDVIEARPEGIHGKVGEGGISLSGGQRQRLGIARALYSDPIVLVMDEATSALDTATEAAVTDAVRALAGDVTTIVVAHRLATIRHSDQVCFMKDGKVAARGTFDEVVRDEPEFARQALLAGLTPDGNLKNYG
ncbi:ABC transporter ATP-binding protein [Flaviflexus salsibiostraticola]|uniref:ABC transporter ATP-binding protein n=1 Tax=Flaviflexus salsibiostraticola TaxID=1282737 RepID=A0A3S8ZBI5_9ACTO|nr:ABC transporter ATP-binding protein [Flaviflexus salsibiostraticola]AZN30842.1 ABC transporter ATP-binding protein [Flaviflexus salsibiostraticola]